MSTRNQNWRVVKAKIIVSFGTLAKASGVLDCSVEGLRQAVKGRCPGIARKMRKAGLLAV